VGHHTHIKSNVFVGPKTLIGARNTINEFVLVGQGSILVSDKAKSIGYNSVIGAGALVVKPVPDNVVAVGCPAEVIKNR
jgi:acetyltransferase-like isoleucine patch superfamily enzyme